MAVRKDKKACEGEGGRYLGHGMCEPILMTKRNYSAEGDVNENASEGANTPVQRVISFEEKYFGNPIAQVAIFGLAIYGAFTVVKALRKKTA